ncbi:hypothetical protein HYPDE_38183 [Hyphomicrobium denitrificans 1NES1]|uniref:Uncharacterized protein n=1 Tax=Hyphomicrobium denitrificans 1NES1 TaxID=670307 RepID=N0B8E7_9HYPH|nr:hypothetical protein [Hyphomicrobium denitrificans]AGK59308.1 hypothetical protein HYPDE_38183 [Hyphomicrobium denitrificans 1NES1]
MKPFTTVTVVLLILIALAHALRLWLGWEVTVNGITIPMWVSAVAFIVTAGLAIGLWRERR